MNVILEELEEESYHVFPSSADLPVFTWVVKIDEAFFEKTYSVII